MTTSELKGYRDFLAGSPLHRNPQATLADRSEWVAGWYHANLIDTHFKRIMELYGHVRIGSEVIDGKGT